MRTFLYMLIASSVLLPARGQQQVIKGKESDIIITPVFHGSLVIEWDGNTIVADPYNGASRYAAFSPGLFLVTHVHPDHLDLATLLSLDYEEARIIAPQKVMDQLDTLKFREKTVLNNGEFTHSGRVKITAVPMYNMPQETARHVKGEGNGYLLEMDGRRIYISGDTEGVPEMRGLENIDVAFVCMNMPYTMDVEAAALAVLAFKPKVVYPYHYRGKDGFSDLEKFRSIVEAASSDIEVRTVDWYPEKPE